MNYSVLVIGYGSIGKRHSAILSAMEEITNLAVLSSQDDISYKTLSSLEDIAQLNPDYIVIASPTNQHHTQLKFLEENLKGRKILVEKPLFDFMSDLEVIRNEVYVGYNLRFHPMMSKIKKLCKNRRLWNIQVFCGSYLPDWRLERNYQETSSANKKLGGGVLLDLSHELDYIQWVAGKIELKYVVNKKVSDLEIDSDDLLILYGRTENGADVQISLNYFTRKPTRNIIIDGDGLSVQGDFITNTLSVVQGDEVSDLSLPGLERNDTYRLQHEAVLKGDETKICNYKQGLETMRLIENIRSWPN